MVLPNQTEVDTGSHSSMSGAMDVLCPMHAQVRPSGHIDHVGPTLAKLRTEMLVGARFLEVFEVIRPRRIQTMRDLAANAGQPLHLRFRAAPATRLRAVLAHAPGGMMIINTSFHGEVSDAVATHNLSLRDFPPTDLTIEMLYLGEAKNAAYEESRKLIMRLQGAKIAAEEQAFTDTLTGLKNRRALDHVLARKMGLKEEFACTKVDLDYFKSINDTQGHAAGDHVLQVAASVLVEETREDDIVARVGGDEFIILFSRLQDTERLDRITRRIIERLEVPVPFNGQVCRISGSLGTAFSDGYGPDAGEEMIHHADVALYASKKAGRARHTLFTPDLLELDLSVAPSGERGALHPDADIAG